MDAVQSVIRRHLRFNRATVTMRELTTLMVKLVPINQELVKFSYVIIVTNETANAAGLCKLPVFCIVINDQHTFIDMSCSVFSSWEAFLESNRLHPCKFCFPVNGHYDVGGKLTIEFASSPAALEPIIRPSWLNVIWGKIVSVGTIVASCVMKITPVCFKVLWELKTAAESFRDKMCGIENQMRELQELIEGLRSGRLSAFDLVLRAGSILMPVGHKVHDAILAAWKEVKKSLSKAYQSLQRMFPEFFTTASSSSQHEFLAITNRVDSQVSTATEEADELLSTINEHDSGFNTQQTNNIYNKKIFENCKDECALGNYTKKFDPEFERTTQEILSISQKVAKSEKVSSLHELKNIFEAISAIVFEEYKHNIEVYTSMVQAARVSAGHKIDLRAFNKTLNIKGNPKDFYMEKALQSVEKARLVYHVNQKIAFLQNQKEITVIPIWKKTGHEGDNTGLYRSIGIRGAGKFSAKSLLDALKAKSFFKESPLTNFTIKEVDSKIAINSEDFSIFFFQTINEENTSEGLVYFAKHN